MTFFVERDRLFDEDVLAGIEGRSRHFEMQKRRRQNGDDVDSRVREQCAIVRDICSVASRAAIARRAASSMSAMATTLASGSARNAARCVSAA